MSDKQLPPAAVPALELSPDEKKRIVHETDEIITETLRANEEFLANNQSLNMHHYRLVKSKEMMRVYRTRKNRSKKNSRKHLATSSNGHSTSNSNSKRVNFLSTSSNSFSGVRLHSTDASSHSSSGVASGYFNGKTAMDRYRPPHVPLFVAAGIIDGTVEDAAFGSLADNEYRWKLKNAYIGNICTEQRVITTIHTPTNEDPFRYLGIKWELRRLGPLITARDFLYAEASGLAVDSNGERVSYSLLHSVEIEEIPELKQFDIIRTISSACYIYRKHDNSSIEVFCRAFCDPRGEIMDSVSASIFAEKLLTSNLIVDCSHSKKLTWLKYQKSRYSQTRSSQKSIASLSTASHCHSCKKNLSTLSKLFQISSVCQVCRQPCCSKCSVSKKVVVDVAVEVTKKQLTFCVMCVIEAKNLSPWDIATASANS